MWDAQVDAFRDSFSVLRFDTRGHGNSSIPLTAYTLADASQDVLALLDHLNIPEAAFCGLSLGGMIGQWLAIHAAERFWTFVICNSAAKIGTPETWNQRIAAVTERGMSAIIPALLERWYTSGFRALHPDVLERTSTMLLHTDPKGYTLACAAIRDMDLRDLIGSIMTPTLVVYGDEDPVTSPVDARFLLDHISNAESLCLPAAHLSNIEAAAVFNDGVLHFLKKTSGRRHDG
jgi:3-oxoadipate enol-lactonase